MSKQGLISVEVRPTLQELRRRHAERYKSLKDVKAAHTKISIFLDSWVQRNFKSEGGNVGGWAPFAAGGRVLRSGVLDTTAKVLQDTGRLRASFLPFATQRTAGIGSDIPYSKSHEEGIGNLPVRRMLPVEREVKRDVQRVYDLHVKQSLEKT